MTSYPDDQGMVAGATPAYIAYLSGGTPVAVTSGTPLPVNASVSPPVAPSSFVTGQAVIAVTNTAVQLASHVLTVGITVVANGTNAGNIFVGGSGVTTTGGGTGNGVVLVPGAAVSISINQSNLVYSNGTAGDWVSFVAN